MRYFKLSVLIIMAISIFNLSCSSGRNAESKNGSSCSYVKYEGYAVIKSIIPAPASEYNCPDNPRKIIFEFTPANLSDRQKYRFANFSDTAAAMRINDGANPSLAWIKSNKIEVGKKYKCFRTEIIEGTCTPAGFIFPDLDLFPGSGTHQGSGCIDKSMKNFNYNYNALLKDQKKILKSFSWPGRHELDLNDDGVNEIFLAVEGYSRGMDYALFTEKNRSWISISGGEGIPSGHLGIVLSENKKNGWHDFTAYQPSGRDGIIESRYTWNGKQYTLIEQLEVQN
jgi:hypothetical protein